MKSFTLKFALLFLLGVGLASTAAAQKIGGVVKDSAGKPVIGASVVVDGTTLGASSGVDGRWTLTVPDASKKTLVISYIGMKTQRIAIGSKTQIDVRLEDESTAMDDVVVVGYATVKRRDVVGSVASVNAETLQQMPVASVAEAMTGRMAGVQVTATEGDPDAEIRIRVRGAGSFSSEGRLLDGHLRFARRQRRRADHHQAGPRGQIGGQGQLRLQHHAVSQHRAPRIRRFEAVRRGLQRGRRQLQPPERLHGQQLGICQAHPQSLRRHVRGIKPNV